MDIAAHGETSLYLAYGSNLWAPHMLARCPTAEPIGTCILTDYKLVFRGYADVEPCKGSGVPCAIYRVHPSDVAALDLYENVASGLYVQVPIKLRLEEQDETGFFYRMQVEGYAPPSAEYVEVLSSGYDLWELDTTALTTALTHSTESGQDSLKQTRKG